MAKFIVENRHNQLWNLLIKDKNGKARTKPILGYKATVLEEFEMTQHVQDLAARGILRIKVAS